LAARLAAATPDCPAALDAGLDAAEDRPGVVDSFLDAVGRLGAVDHPVGAENADPAKARSNVLRQAYPVPGLEAVAFPSALLDEEPSPAA
jgi:hypothetical protein